MSEWKYLTLNQMGKIARGKSKHRPRNDPRLYGGRYPFIQTADVKAANLYLTSYSQTYNEDGLAQSKLWPEETLCITIAANIADTAILSFPACFPDSIMGFQADNNVCLVRYVKYCFDILQAKCKQISQGAAQDNLSWERLSSIEFPVPAIELQIKICSILSSYDELIENNRKEIKLLEEAAQRLYKEWFIDFKFPGHETTPIDPETNLPEGWKKGTVSELFQIVNGFAFKSETFVERGSYSIVTIKNVKDGQFDSLGMATIDELPERMPCDCILHRGDILLSLTGNVGRTCIITAKDCLLNQRVGKVVSNYPTYSYCFLRNSRQQSRMVTLANGTAQLNLSPVRFCEDFTIVPSGYLLEEFEQVTHLLITEIIFLSEQVTHLQEARDRLLPKLMSGEIEVN